MAENGKNISEMSEWLMKPVISAYQVGMWEQQEWRKLFGQSDQDMLCELSASVELNAKSVHNIAARCVSAGYKDVWQSSTKIGVSELVFHVFSDLNKKETTYWAA